MPQYHEPPATLTEAEWDGLVKTFQSVGRVQTLQTLRKVGNAPQRAGDLFCEKDVYSMGQDRINTALRKSRSDFALSRINDSGMNWANTTTREDRKLALVRRPRK
ncbi:hypothetical protein A3C18_00050 [Candidatus Kaiserbacteria bacterium RIFCSPHIGHO2_02_FULL_54_11b]|uniref:Uncharacterized protein n=1 Tax=Candidatus Kaiserbacteria bacterium RIFCSPHIGHO2_02_FULL_54_11b TaxID=1798494 RepID=A0A1F6DSD8_9BACT|nr:MAG: hypothetical protein A3C18_00050 [Candidatus Kaiserbacteria bacterium RIFCSPHIGHO2_02_FULL_54_11b]